MKGLIYKDLSLIGRQGKFFIVYIVLMVAIFSGIGDGAASMSSFMAVVCFMLSINCFAYDEQNGFDKLVASCGASNIEPPFNKQSPLKPWLQRALLVQYHRVFPLYGMGPGHRSRISV